jgi:soluble lytic murein transglycosylase-like protein
MLHNIQRGKLVGTVDNIYLSKLAQVNEMLQSRMSSAGVSSSDFSDILNKAIDESSATAQSASDAQSVPVLAELPNESQYESLVKEIGLKYDLDPNLIKAVIRNESRFKKNALSSAGAMGLMQLMPGTAGDMGVTNAYDAYQNVDGGAKYLKTQIKRFGDVRLALAAYNCGPSRVASYGINNADSQDEYSRIPERVRNYVDNVLGYYVQYINQA